jgi:hypothetical protein
MAKETQVRRISRDAVAAFHYPRSALLDCFAQLDTSIEPMNPP